MRLRSVGIILVAAVGLAQTTRRDLPEFEVASVKPAAPQDAGPGPPVPAGIAELRAFRGGPGSPDPGRIDYSGVTLKMLLARAYDLRAEQIYGPGWIDKERYTVAAKLPPGTDAEQLRLMLQGLLADRFRVRLHRESKEMTVYRLTVAKNGPKLNPAEKEPEYKDEAERNAAMQAGGKEALAEMTRKYATAGITRWFGLKSATIQKFAETLSNKLDHPVKDMTQLEGSYSFYLEWAERAPSVGLDEPSGPSIFSAIQEQLGLRLEAGKEPVELLVIDGAERPSEN
jgi:uncharacterized protein (TIGR03435 family)